MNNVYRYLQLSPTEKALHNKLHYKVRRIYYQQRSIERIAVCAYMHEHPEIVEEIRKKYARQLMRV